MKKAYILLVMCALLLPLNAVAAELKIGIVNMAMIMNEAEPVKKVSEALRKKFEPMEKELKQKQEEIEKLRSELEKQNMMLSQEAKQDRQLEFRRKVEDYQVLLASHQRKMKGEEEKVVTPVLQQIRKVIDEYGKEKGYSLILDRYNPVILYVDKAIDVTNEVLVLINKSVRAQ